MAMTNDGQLQKLTQDEQMSSHDSRPMTEDKLVQIRIPDEPAPRHNKGLSYHCSGLWPTITKVAMCFAILAGVILFFVWVFTLPGISVYVESASLTSFNLSSPNTLHHNLSVELSIRNPSSSNVGYYIQVETSAYYEGKRFQRAPIDDFYVSNTSITMLRAVMAGTTTVDLGASGMELYEKQREAGAFDLEVRLEGMMWYEIWSEADDMYTWDWRTDAYRCFLPGLRLRATDGFVRTKCKTGGWFSDFRDQLGLSVWI